ncbi:hypothetical protein ABC974_00295 [Sphingomonas oligophenolica]|uniref:Uncharacterized protein n=1 Tax=Sphingomonas oligophenolica TaxID=301154 RepID=A0ABU9XWX2_9SPHN
MLDSVRGKLARELVLYPPQPETKEVAEPAKIQVFRSRGAYRFGIDRHEHCLIN